MEFEALYNGKFTLDEIGFIQIAQSRVLSAVARGEIDQAIWHIPILATTPFNTSHYVFPSAQTLINLSVDKRSLSATLKAWLK
jgi:hypothetical protein